MSRFLSDLVNSDALRLGLALAAFGAAALAVAVATWRPARPVPIGGAAFAGIVGFAAWRELGLSATVALGAALMVGGAMLGRELWEWLLGVTPGAIILVRSSSEIETGVVIASVVALVLVTGLVIDFDRTFRDSAIGLPLLGITVVGVLINVPDTERAFALLGAVLPLTLLGWPLRLVSLGSSAAAATALIGWVAISAGTVRPGAAVGAFAALGLMLAEPLGRRLLRGGRSALVELAGSGRLRSLIVIAIHGALVLGVSRLAGLREGAGGAILIAVAVLVPGVILGAARLPSRGAGVGGDRERKAPR